MFELRRLQKIPNHRFRPAIPALAENSIRRCRCSLVSAEGNRSQWRTAESSENQGADAASCKQHTSWARGDPSHILWVNYRILESGQCRFANITEKVREVVTFAGHDRTAPRFLPSHRMKPRKLQPHHSFRLRPSPDLEEAETYQFCFLRSPAPYASDSGRSGVP